MVIKDMKLKFCVFLVCLSVTFAVKKCFRDGLCLGNLQKVYENIPDKHECLKNCQHYVEGCNFASFNADQKTCALTLSCSKIVLQDSYQHSNVKCSRKYFNFTKVIYQFFL